MQAHIHPITGRKHFLGKLPHVPDEHDLLFAKYIDKAKLFESTQAPALIDWTAIPTITGARPMPDTDPLGNDSAGDCVLAAPGHAVNLIGQQTGNLSLAVTRGMVLAAYSKYTGYVDGDPSTDNGWYVRDMLKAWAKDGLYGTNALGFAAVDWKNPEEVALAVFLSTGAVFGGYSLPGDIWSQVDDKGNFDWKIPEGGSAAPVGGHCMQMHGVNNWNTWGASAIAEQTWVDSNCDELYFVLVDKSAMATGRAPNGFALTDLLADVKARQEA